MIYGHPRVSTDDRSVDDQVGQRRASGASRAFLEPASETETGRARLRQVIGQRAAGDVLMVVGLDRLARSIREPIARPGGRRCASATTAPRCPAR